MLRGYRPIRTSNGYLEAAGLPTLYASSKVSSIPLFSKNRVIEFLNLNYSSIQYSQPGPDAPKVAPPRGNLRIAFDLHTVEEEVRVCRRQYHQIPTLPNVTTVNSLGSFKIGIDRLALIDGRDAVLRAGPDKWTRPSGFVD